VLRDVFLHLEKNMKNICFVIQFVGKKLDFLPSLTTFVL